MPERTLLEHSDEALTNTHPATACNGQWCTIHNRSDHHMRQLPQHWRSDRGIMERICPHGIGHPDPDSPWPNESSNWTHGCDGCCDPDTTQADRPTAEHDTSELETLRAENARLRSQITELLPFVLSEVRAGLELGPPPADHSADNCSDCVWYDESAAWKERLTSGEFGPGITI
jgi:hypothetical protein